MSGTGISGPRAQYVGWWLDHLAGSFVISIFNPLVSFFSWPLVMAGGTTLRVVVERRTVVTRAGAFRKSYVMAAVQATAVVVLWLLDGGERADLTILAFWVLLLAVVPTLLYAALMPLAGQRWLSLSMFTRGRFSRAQRRRAE